MHMVISCLRQCLDQREEIVAINLCLEFISGNSLNHINHFSTLIVGPRGRARVDKNLNVIVEFSDEK